MHLQFDIKTWEWNKIHNPFIFMWLEEVTSDEMFTVIDVFLLKVIICGVMILNPFLFLITILFSYFVTLDRSNSRFDIWINCLWLLIINSFELYLNIPLYVIFDSMRVKENLNFLVLLILKSKYSYIVTNFKFY